MLFLAAQRGEPVAFSCTRPGTPVLNRGDGVPEAREAIHGAYVFKPFRENEKPKKVLAISGRQVMHNALEILPEIEERSDVRRGRHLAAALEESRRTDPVKAAAIMSGEERQYVVALHNGWPGFLYPFVMPGDYQSRVFGMDRFSRSGKPDEIYRQCGLRLREGLRKKILSGSTSGAGTNRPL